MKLAPTSAALFLMLFAAGCGPKTPSRTVLSGAPSNAPAAQPSPPVPPTSPLGPTRTEHFQRVHDVLRPALASWGLTGLGTDCSLTFSDRDQWLVGCELESTPGFRPTGESVLGRPVLWSPDPVTFGGKHAPYEQVKLGLVGTVAESDRGDGTSTPVLVVQDWETLHAHHPGFTTSAVDEWYGIAIHEAFHAHQMWHPRIRTRLDAWKKEQLASSEDLGKVYAENAVCKRAIDDEIEMLRKATASARDAARAKTALLEWLARREARRAKLEPALERALPGKRGWEMDGFLTFLEGTARYVEASFLLSTPAGARLTPTTLPGLSNGGAKYVYVIGMYVSFLLDRADPTWKARIFDNDELLIGAAKAVSGGAR